VKTEKERVDNVDVGIIVVWPLEYVVIIVVGTAVIMGLDVVLGNMIMFCSGNLVYLIYSHNLEAKIQNY
jgi:hypothetical protein